jgi:hypothetical protein
LAAAFAGVLTFAVNGFVAGFVAGFTAGFADGFVAGPATGLTAVFAVSASFV